MTVNPPYKIGDIIKFKNGPYVEYLGPSPRGGDRWPAILCRFIKSNHGVPIACRTRHHKHENHFKKNEWVEKNRRWQYTDWLPVVGHNDNVKV